MQKLELKGQYLSEEERREGHASLSNILLNRDSNQMDRILQSFGYKMPAKSLEEIQA